MQSLAAGLVPFSPIHTPFFPSVPIQLGFFETSHTHTRGCVFRSTSYRRWKINKNSEKCEKMCIRFSAQGWPGWCRVPDLGDFIDLHRYRYGLHPLQSTQLEVSAIVQI